jgi:hypothetical protein
MAQARLRQRLGWCAAGLALAGWLAGCSHAPLSATDCGRHFAGGSGLLGLIAAAGAFDRGAGPECRVSTLATASRLQIPPSAVYQPPEPPPFPENRPSLLVPGGGGTLMEIGGGAPGLLVPAGGGTFLELP